VKFHTIFAFSTFGLCQQKEKEDDIVFIALHVQQFEALFE